MATMKLIETTQATLNALILMDADKLMNGFGKLDKSERVSTIGKIKLAIALNSKGEDTYTQFKEVYNISRTWSSRALRCESVIKSIEYDGKYETTEFTPSALFEMVEIDDIKLIEYLADGTITPTTSIRDIRDLKKVIEDVSRETEETDEDDTTVVNTANEHVEIPTQTQPKDIVIPYELFINMFNQLKEDAVNTKEKASKYLR